jgi:hypothetical protein
MKCKIFIEFKKEMTELFKNNVIYTWPPTNQGTNNFFTNPFSRPLVLYNNDDRTKKIQDC